MSEAIITTFIDRVHHAFLEGDPAAADKQAEAANVGHLRRQYRALAEGDFGAFSELLADDVELEICGPPDTPFLGRWRGRQQVAEAVRQNFAQVEDQRPEVQSVVAQGDTVVIVARERGRFRASGQPYDLHWVQVHTFRDGKLARVRELVSGAPPDPGQPGS